MAKIAFLSFPAYGHMYPAVPILRELVREGHAVTVYGEGLFEPSIRAVGADFVGYPPAVSTALNSAALNDGDLIRWLDYLFSATAPVLADVLPRLERDRPDLLMFDAASLWGEMAAKRLKLPSVSLSTAFIFELRGGPEGPREIATYWGRVISRMPSFTRAWTAMARFGAGNLPRRMPVLPRPGTLTLVLTSTEVHPRTRFFKNPSFAFVGATIEPSTRTESFDFSRLDGRPVLYVSIGTVHFGNRDFFDRCAQALGDLPVQVLMSAGPSADLAAFSHMPANFTVARAFPQLAVLERASAFVSHAGLNSVHEALWYGVPMVAVPHQFEQLRNAQAVSAAGAAVTLDGEAFGRPVTPAELRAGVEAVLADRPRFAANARRLGQTLRDAGGTREAVRRITALLPGG